MDDNVIIEDVSKTKREAVPLHKKYYAILSLGCAFSVIPCIIFNSSIYWDLFEYPVPLLFWGIVVYYDKFIIVLSYMIILLGLFFGLLEQNISTKHQLSKKIAGVCIAINLIMAVLSSLLWFLSITAFHPS